MRAALSEGLPMGCFSSEVKRSAASHDDEKCAIGRLSRHRSEIAGWGLLLREQVPELQQPVSHPDHGEADQGRRVIGVDRFE